jgi:hypothetical protein
MEDEHEEVSLDVPNIPFHIESSDFPSPRPPSSEKAQQIGRQNVSDVLAF